MEMFSYVLFIGLGLSGIVVWSLYQSGLMDGVEIPGTMLTIALYSTNFLIPIVVSTISVITHLGIPIVHVIFGILFLVRMKEIAQYQKSSKGFNKYMSLVFYSYPIFVVISDIINELVQP